MISKLMLDASIMLSRGMAPGNERYLPRGMYIEYENVAAPGDTPAAPAFDVSDTIEYYADLDVVADRDYLRVNLGFMTPESSDVDTYPDGNTLVFIGNPSDGGPTVGVHGKPFSSGSNSKIVGGAVVAIVDTADRSKDLQLVRFYLQGAEQFLFNSGSQKLIVVRWPILIPDA